jgi:hypothetical protein
VSTPANASLAFLPTKIWSGCRHTESSELLHGRHGRNDAGEVGGSSEALAPLLTAGRSTLGACRGRRWIQVPPRDQ